MLNGFRFLADHVMTMDSAAWTRHANPWSGWSRVLILPLLAAAAWSRVWIGWWALLPIGAVLILTWLNPRLFPPPRSTNNWMSKGVQGERIWLLHGTNPVLAHHVPVIRALVIATSLGSLSLLLGIVFLDQSLTLTGLAVAMLSKLWLLDRMVWVGGDYDARVSQPELPGQ